MVGSLLWSAMNLFQARYDGTQAFHSGKQSEACPFYAGSDEYGAWMRGFHTARFGATDPVSTQQGTHHEQRLIFGSDRS